MQRTEYDGMAFDESMAGLLDDILPSDLNPFTPSTSDANVDGGLAPGFGDNQNNTQPNVPRGSGSGGGTMTVVTNDPAPAGDLIIRSAPNASAPVVGAAEKGGNVTVLDTGDGTWTRISWAGGNRRPAAEGWAHSAYLKAAGTPQPTPSTIVKPATPVTPTPAVATVGGLDPKLLMIGGGVLAVIVVGALLLGGKKKKKK